jgi:Ser/Thr protein kinase RdoA (MazF antagonist)
VTQTNPFLLRTIAKAAIVLCYQHREPLTVHVSLWTTAAGLPITAANWRRLRHLKLIAWSGQAWHLTPASARLLRDNKVRFSRRLVKSAGAHTSRSQPRRDH